MLDQKYQVVCVLGVGGMGRVYEGRHTRIGRRVAIKFVLPEFASNPEILRRFENEARAAGSLEHENIAAVHDFGETPDGSLYLVMEYLEGEDCDRLLIREGPLPVGRAIDILLQVCRGLHVAHGAGIVHRDLKPANLFLSKRADGSDLVKVLDFGIAKLRSNTGGSGTATGLAMGTAHYMSPEQARGARDVDERTDVYAIGVILYELLTGKKPHDGQSYLEIIYSILNKVPPPIETLRQDLPAGLPAVIAQAMHGDATVRYRTVADLGRALASFTHSRIPSFRPRESLPNAEVTIASPEESVRSGGGGSTMAPVTPRTRVSVAPTGTSTKRSVALAAVAVAIVAVATGVGLHFRSAGASSTGQASVGLVVTSVPLHVAEPSGSSAPEAGSSSSPIVSSTPEGGNTGSAVGRGHDRSNAGSNAHRTEAPAKSPASPPPPPAATPAPAAPGTVDISREIPL